MITNVGPMTPNARSKFSFVQISSTPEFSTSCFSGSHVLSEFLRNPEISKVRFFQISCSLGLKTKSIHMESGHRAPIAVYRKARKKLIFKKRDI